MRLFLSYVRQDQQVVEAFAGHLRRAGFEAFLDTGLTGGQRWWDELIRQIQLCDGFMPVLTAGYLYSRPCKLEAAYATALEKPIVPVQMDEISPRLLPPAIGDVQWVRYAAEDVNSLLDLVKALNSLPACPQLPDPLPDAPPVPVSYMEQLIDLLDSPQELTNAEQRNMLVELKSRLGGDEDEDARELLRRLKRRSDLQHVIALDIDEALKSPFSIPHGHADQPSSPVAPDSEPVASGAPTHLTPSPSEHISSRSDLGGREQTTQDPGHSSEALSGSVLQADGRGSGSSVSPPDAPGPPVAKDEPASGASGDGSMDTRRDVSHGRRRRSWIIGAAAVLIVLAAVGVFLGLQSGGGSPSASSGMHSPDTGSAAMGSDAMSFTGGTTGPPTPVDKKLLTHLDPSVRDTCEGYNSHGSWPHSTGGLRCSDPVYPAISVTYIQFPNGQLMNDHFHDFQASNAGSPPEGDCLKAPYSTTAREENVLRIRESDGGPQAAPADLVCLPSKGDLELVWENAGVNVIGEAKSDNATKLVQFWYVFAGPYGTE